jgi:hypothetical protein
MRNRIHILFLAVMAVLLIAGDVVRVPPEREENSVGPDEVYFAADSVIMCGQLVDADAPNNTQTFFGHASLLYIGIFTDYGIGDAACNDLDSTTEATADTPLTFATDAPAFKVNGFYCIISKDPTNDVTFTLRSAGANTTPTISCTVTGNAKSCSTTTGSTTDIAAGATIAMQADYTENLDAEDAWCKMYFSVRRK